MKIEVEFVGYVHPYWKEKLQHSADKAARVMSLPSFLARVAMHPKFDFCSDTPRQVSEKLAALDVVKVKFGTYYKRWTAAIAYESDGVVYVNTRKEFAGAGGPGNIAHEVQHVLGYSHNGNAWRTNLNTEPYRIGEWVDEVCNSQPLNIVMAFIA